MNPLREELETRSSAFGRLTDEQWRFLEEDGWLHGYQTKRYLPQDLLDAVEDRFGPQKRMLLGTKRRNYYEAVSEALAIVAGSDPIFVAYRKQFLPDGLVEWDNVEQWIQARAKTPTRWKTVPIGTTRKHQPEDRGRLRFLHYITPNPQAPRTIPTTVDGELETLREMAEFVAPTYGWLPSQAATFILTGITPAIEPITARFHERYPLTSASRFVLEVDTTVPPKELADFYGRIRKRHLEGRTKRITLKHQRLALFVPREDDDKTWRERMEAWNKKYPKEKYASRRNFRRDVTTAQDRLLRPW